MDYILMTGADILLARFNTEKEAIEGYEKYQSQCQENFGKQMPCRLFYNFSKPIKYIREFKKEVF